MNENTLDFLMSLAKTDLQKEIIKTVLKMNTEGMENEDVLKELLVKMKESNQ